MKCEGVFPELPSTLFSCFLLGAFTRTLWSCTQTSIFSPCPQFRTICEGTLGNNLCLLLLNGPFRAEIQDAETGKGEEMLRCPHGTVSSAMWHEQHANLSPCCSPSFSRPSRLKAVLASAAYLPRHCLPQSPVLAQGLLLHPRGASPLDGDSHNSIVVMALPKLVLAQRLAANRAENPEKRVPGFACFKVSVISPSA